MTTTKDPLDNSLPLKAPTPCSQEPAVSLTRSSTSREEVEQFEAKSRSLAASSWELRPVLLP